MKIKDMLALMIKYDASDLYLASNSPPRLKVIGEIMTIGDENLIAEEISNIAQSLITENKWQEFLKQQELNAAFAMDKFGRFRLNVFQQRGDVSIVIRRIKTDLLSFEQLNLPPVLKELTMYKHGLILVVGATASGKSTTLATMIDYRNQHSKGHIITIEDPIEFVHPHQGCIINQREVGLDTLSYENALQNTLRQAPDVIFIGEIRSRETMEHALTFTQTGHLCLSTLHANNAEQTLERMLNFFPEEMHKQVLMDISLNLTGIIAQRLVPTIDKRRIAAIEVLINSPFIRDLIREGNINGIKDAMKKSETTGMKTFDDALFELYKAGKITAENAVRNADSKNNLHLKISLDKGETSNVDLALEQEKKEDTNNIGMGNIIQHRKTS